MSLLQAAKAENLLFMKIYLSKMFMVFFLKVYYSVSLLGWAR